MRNIKFEDDIEGIIERYVNDLVDEDFDDFQTRFKKFAVEVFEYN